MHKLPFSLTTRKNSPYYYVRFRNEQTGGFMSWISTKETNYNRALRKAWDLYNTQSAKIDTLSFYDTIKKSNYTKEDVQFFLDDFIKKGFITSYVANDNSTQNMLAFQWLLDFWDFEKSPYLAEKKRKGQSVHKKHAQNSQSFLIKYWKENIKEKRLGELSRKDVQKMFDNLDDLDLNGNTKNHILRAFLTPMKWAYNNELIAKDISKGWTMYKAVYKERKILTRAMAEAVFKIEWGNDFAKVASMLSMCTGLRCGEIQALTAEDLGEYYIDVHHSWNKKDGLKCTKNGEERRVYVPFPSLMNTLRNMAECNPHTEGNRFVFWGLTPQSPIDCNVFRKFFRRDLVECGMTEAEAKGYSFHAWRHFYTTYMVDRVNAKALQSQTGHKTREMLEHYSKHQTIEDAKLITAAQELVFGDIVE